MSNFETNQKYYNDKYMNYDVSSIKNIILNWKQFFYDAKQTDTSWVGFYYGGFEKMLEGKNVLELGCGDGLNAFIMSKLGANVTALDISKESVRLINGINNELKMNVQAISGDFLTHSFNTSYDMILGKAFLHHLDHDNEIKYLRKIVDLLHPDGEARFFEPAVNSRFLDAIRWAIPVPGRPSKLNIKAFELWRANDPHPVRENSSAHYISVGSSFFKKTKIIPIGGIERFHRVLPKGKLNRKFRRFAHRIDNLAPFFIRYRIARSQTIIFSDPIQD